MRAFVCGCLTTRLSADELAFVRETTPWGLILFRRNVESREQLRALTAEFRAAVGRDDAPVLMDQEGGRVQRLAPPNWPAYPAAASFEALGPGRAEEAARLTMRLMAHDLREVGVTIDCAPDLDVSDEATHAVIGTRSYSRDPGRVAALGRAAMEGLIAGGVCPVVKHMPGHGRARVDSHLELPVVEASREELERDFAPFRVLRDAPAGMTAHVVYTAIDRERPGTTSHKVLTELLRGEFGFDGLLFTDDLSMKALGGPFGERARAALAAGADIALHCVGDMAEARAVAEAAPALAGKSLERAKAALAIVARGPDGFDVEAGRARLAEFFPAS